MWAEERNKKRQIGTNIQTSLQSNLGSHPHHNGTDKEPQTTGERHRGAESAQQTLEPDPVSTGVGSRIFSVPSPMQRARTFPFQRRKEKPHVTHHRHHRAQASGAPFQPKLASQRNRYRRCHRRGLRYHLLDLGYRREPRRQDRARRGPRIPPAHRRGLATRWYPRRPAHPQARRCPLLRARCGAHLGAVHRRCVERRDSNLRYYPGHRR